MFYYQFMILEDDYRKDSLPAEASEKNPNERSYVFNLLSFARRLRNFFIPLDIGQRDSKIGDPHKNEVELNAISPQIDPPSIQISPEEGFLEKLEPIEDDDDDLAGFLEKLEPIEDDDDDLAGFLEKLEPIEDDDDDLAGFLEKLGPKEDDDEDLAGFLEKQEPKDDIEDLGELEPEKRIDVLDEPELEQGLEQLITQFFQKDVQYMIGLSEKGEELTRGWNKNELFLRFRALVLPNSNDPHGLPMIIMRPTDRPQRDESNYYNGSSSEMYHTDIWRDWKKLAETYPNSNRAAVFNALDQEAGGYRDAVHLYLKITTNSENRSVIELESGWIDFQDYLARKLSPDYYNPKLSPKESKSLIKKLKAYGIDAVVVNEKEEPISVEKIILEEMMGPVIENNAERLRAIVTNRAASEYRNLAYKFLTNPNPDKSSPLYYKFLEYEDLLQRLDGNGRKK